MKTIKKIEIISLARVLGCLIGGFYLAAGIIINIFTLILGLPVAGAFDFLGFGSSILATVLLAVVSGVMGFALGALFAILYNICAALVGGIAWQEAEIKQKAHNDGRIFSETNFIPPQSINSQEEPKDTFSV